MTKRILIDASNEQETRIASIQNDIIEDFEYEVVGKKQLRGNVYLARVSRVEPSLQAAFVEYGGNRQGFLAFSEIHPDYYRIPVEDRAKLLETVSKEVRMMMMKFKLITMKMLMMNFKKIKILKK